MHNMPYALREAQLLAPFATPLVKVELLRRRGSTIRLDWDLLQLGEYEWYDENDDTFSDILDNYWKGQSFTPLMTSYVDRIDLKLYRTGSPGNGYLSIFATDVSGHPCAPELAQVTIDGNVLTTSADGAWYTYTLAETLLTKGVKYAIVLRFPTGNAGNKVSWRGDNTNPPYNRGCSLTSTNDGVDWSLNSGYDMMFRCYYSAYVDSSHHAQPDAFIDCTMPADGSLCRIRGSGTRSYSRIVNPDPDSDFSQWDDWLTTCSDVAITSLGTEVLAFSLNSNGHLYRRDSSDSGASFAGSVDMGYIGASYANYHVAACFKYDGDAIVIYTDGSTVYRRRRISASWEAQAAWSNSLSSVTGLAVYHQGDWNVIVTGVDTSSQAGVWSTLLGDGYTMPPDTWADLEDIIVRESTESFEYSAPSLDQPWVFELTFLEKYTTSEIRSLTFRSHGYGSADWISGLVREPIPFNYFGTKGVALTHSGQYNWMCASNRVWRAWQQYTPINLTTDVIEMEMRQLGRSLRSKLLITLDNTGGVFNDFDRQGWAVKVSIGYNTTDGPKYIEQPHFFVTGWTFVSPPWFPLRAIWAEGVEGTLTLECEDMWNLAYRWHSRRRIEYPADSKNISQLLAWVLARIGFEFSSSSYSDGIFLRPEFTILEGRSGKWMVRKLLSWVQDVVRQQRDMVYLSNPLASDAGDHDIPNNGFSSGTLDTWRTLWGPMIIPLSEVITPWGGGSPYTRNVDYVMDYNAASIKCLSTGSIPPSSSLNAAYTAVPFTYHSIYGNAHLLYRGQYAHGMSDPNYAQVWGDADMAEAYDFEGIAKVEDRFIRISKPDYPDIDSAKVRADAEIRKGEMYRTKGGFCQVAPNVGQELWDIIRITDVPGGITSEDFRIIGIYTTYKLGKWGMSQYMQKFLLCAP